MASSKVKFQTGKELIKVPKVSGLYAWYYKPLVVDSQTAIQSISSFFDFPGRISTEVEMRYGVRLVANAYPITVHGYNRESAEDVIKQTLSSSGVFINELFKSDALEIFTKPLYIGMAKNLHKRVYLEHYQLLDELWNDQSPISTYLRLNPQSTVRDVMDNLDIDHSFALEARVRKIATRDLMVRILQTNYPGSDQDSDDRSLDRTEQRALEKLLQIISDPVCGRR